MPARLARPVLLAFALLVPATGVWARTHHHAATTHHTTKRAASKHETGKSATRHRTGQTTHGRRERHETKPVERHAAAPGGATTVPGGGLKVFCPAGKGPLLIRKATQGAGTTVTVVCR